MPRDVNGVYSAPPGTAATTNTPIGSAAYNTFVSDLVSDANTPRPVSAGGTGAASAAAARVALGVAIGTDVQAYDADLAAIAALTSAADRAPYATGAGTWALMTVTSFIRTLLDDTDNATALATLGGQPLDPDLTAIAALARTRGDIIRGGASAWERLALGASGEALVSNGTDIVWGMPESKKLLATLTTNSGTTQTASGLTLTQYKTLFITVAGVSFTAAGQLTTNGANLSASTGSGAGSLDGFIRIDLTTGVAIAEIGVGSGNNLNTYMVASGLTTASTSVSFGGGTFDAGTIRIYGER